ncbi:uncharacterized protein LACBIDRAFT_305223 [Laccaria bicolor S238N-H82]|uniref:Predicted protein n=1 Tax=Laccaria bicolor (strain S238N-H82 / ATCC MYA-4686) TaxID=486041 RepID=B0CTQ5_LACBS|nr:uncharacterized protein LACBIDRAFT_305223 [Laccaria bicolor S238N-H82]EDR13960.1 predicted protein [Laccaria bicolor S238N-H82]|eukprot:XP_001874519.1 predicted protein [Laccaria bicolor S238N-H82]
MSKEPKESLAIPSPAADASGSTPTSSGPQQLRDLPKIDPYPFSILAVVTIIHPANGVELFEWQAYDRLPGPELQFGVHVETLLTACQIVANNEPGYLSKHQGRDDERIDVDLGSILAPGHYYYHVEKVALNPYPICRDFKSWTFPHGDMPRSWSIKSPALPKNLHWGSSWSAVSFIVKLRDKKCRVTGSSEWLSTAHLIPEEERSWLRRNKMYAYLVRKPPHYQSPCNLLALRYDCHLGGFDRAQFVFVPKWGKLAVHFLCDSMEFANQYHNTIFHGDALSIEALYSRFAWAVLKLVADTTKDSEDFEFVEMPKENGKGGGKGGGSSRKRKREDEDGGEGDQDSENNKDAADQSGAYQTASRTHKRPDVLLHGPNAWLSDVLSQLDDGTDARELEEDLDTAACLPFLGFLVDSNIEPTAYQWELPWYPGVSVVEKLKKKYIVEHPNVRAHNLPEMSNESQSNGVLDDGD